MTNAKAEAFGRRLTALLDARGLSKSDFARLIWGSYRDPKTGYMVAKSRERITAWVNGKAFPTDENLELIASALGITAEELVKEETPRPRKRRAYHILPPVREVA